MAARIEKCRACGGSGAVTVYVNWPYSRETGEESCSWCGGAGVVAMEASPEPTAEELAAEDEAREERMRWQDDAESYWRGEAEGDVEDAA